MKTIILAIAALTCTTVFAQPRIPGRNDLEKKATKEVKSIGKEDNTNNNTPPKEDTPTKPTAGPTATEASGPAKGQISTFWKHIEKMRNHTKEDNKQVVYSSGLQGAKSALNNTKIKDPSYNTAEMEKALAECQAVYDGVASGKQDLRDSREKTAKELKQFFDWQTKNMISYNYQSNETDAEKIQRVRDNDDSIARYKQLAVAYVNQTKDPIVYKDWQAYVKNIAKSHQEPYDKKDKYPGRLTVPMHHLTDPESMYNLGSFSLVQEVKELEAYFYAATVIYPNEPDLIKAYEWCKKAVAEVGTTDQFLAKINKSQGDYLKKVKFPAAKVNDAALEAEFKKHFNALGYKETITKVNVQSTDWTIDRNELTGVIVGRSKQAYIATKTADGTCYVTEFWIMQDYNGSGYGSFRNVTNNSFRSKLACENVK